MPWYRVTVNHGPGHQSKSEWYFWEDVRMTYQEKKDYFDEHCSHMDWPIGKIHMVKKLPEKVKKEKLEHLQRHLQYEIEYAKKMTKVLNKTKVRKTKRPTMSRKAYLFRMKMDRERREAQKKLNRIYPEGTKRTFANQNIRIRLKCNHKGCKKFIKGIEGYNGSFVSDKGEHTDLRNKVYLCEKHKRK